MLPAVEDTIVALSSSAAPVGRGLGRTILRLSGPSALGIAASVFEGDLRAGDAGWRRVDGRIAWRTTALPVAAYVMPGPHSYTRQDVVELHLPAMPAASILLGEVLERLLEAGARPALPGEFTRRASINGRITPAQAEAVGRLLRAESADEARRWSLRATSHAVTNRDRLRKSIEELVALIELNLDFSAEDVELLSPDDLGQHLAALNAGAPSTGQDALSETESGGLLASALPRVVLAGPANAGKSSLLNALAGEEWALVSDRAHTTRDVVEADLEWAPGIWVQVLDTAGLGEVLAADPARLLLDQALAQTRQTLRTADVLVVVIDPGAGAASLGQAQQLKILMTDHAPGALVVVWSKADAPKPSDWPAHQATIRETLFESSQVEGGGSTATFSLSAHTGAGLDAFREHISQLIQQLQGRLRAAQASSEAAERQATRTAREALARAVQAHDAGLGEDAVVVELREAVHALGRAEGVLLRHDALTESLLDRIFADFCIGK